MTATFLKVKESVELGQRVRLLSYGPTFRPITIGQPFKREQRIKKGPYILPNKKIFDLENKDSPDKQMWM